MSVSKILEEIEKLARSKNWGSTPENVNIPEKFALIHTEVAEAFEAYRRGNLNGKDGVSEELADIVIRTFHLCLILNVDIDKQIRQKIVRNYDRTWDHPNETVKG
jgi:NTP pyrophosphatase (non-canonical NTP hydrolase)